MHLIEFFQAITVTEKIDEFDKAENKCIKWQVCNRHAKKNLCHLCADFIGLFVSTLATTPSILICFSPLFSIQFVSIYVLTLLALKVRGKACRLLLEQLLSFPQLDRSIYSSERCFLSGRLLL